MTTCIHTSLVTVNWEFVKGTWHVYGAYNLCKKYYFSCKLHIRSPLPHSTSPLYPPASCPDIRFQPSTFNVLLQAPHTLTLFARCPDVCVQPLTFNILLQPLFALALSAHYPDVQIQTSTFSIQLQLQLLALGIHWYNLLLHKYNMTTGSEACSVSVFLHVSNDLNATKPNRTPDEYIAPSFTVFTNQIANSWRWRLHMGRRK